MLGLCPRFGGLPVVGPSAAAISGPFCCCFCSSGGSLLRALLFARRCFSGRLRRGCWGWNLLRASLCGWSAGVHQAGRGGCVFVVLHMSALHSQVLPGDLPQVKYSCDSSCPGACLARMRACSAATSLSAAGIASKAARRQAHMRCPSSTLNTSGGLIFKTWSYRPSVVINTCTHSRQTVCVWGHCVLRCAH